MTKVLGWMALAGLLLVALAVVALVGDVAYPFPFALLCAGVALFALAGIAWGHTRGKRLWRIAVLGAVGYAAGAPAGLYASLYVGEWVTGPDRLTVAIWLAIVGWWVGGILCGSLASWWGISFHRRYGGRGG